MQAGRQRCHQIDDEIRDEPKMHLYPLIAACGNRSEELRPRLASPTLFWNHVRDHVEKGNIFEHVNYGKPVLILGDAAFPFSSSTNAVNSKADTSSDYFYDVRSILFYILNLDRPYAIYQAKTCILKGDTAPLAEDFANELRDYVIGDRNELPSSILANVGMDYYAVSEDRITYKTQKRKAVGSDHNSPKALCLLPSSSESSSENGVARSLDKKSDLMMHFSGECAVEPLLPVNEPASTKNAPTTSAVGSTGTVNDPSDLTENQSKALDDSQWLLIDEARDAEDGELHVQEVEQENEIEFIGKEPYVINVDSDCSNGFENNESDNYSHDSDMERSVRVNYYSREESGMDIIEAGDASRGKKDTVLGVTTEPCFDAINLRTKAKRLRFPTELDEFDQEIWHHWQLNGQDDRTFEWKMQAKQMLHEIIMGICPDLQVVAIGSTVNGCGSYNSDMDLCVFTPLSTESRDDAIDMLSKLHEAYCKRKDVIKLCRFIRAKVPILKITMTGAYDKLDVDINHNNRPGIFNTHLIHYYSRIDDRFPALCLVIKHWAIRAGINDAMYGTLSSYSLVLMVVHYLQCAVNPPVLPNLNYLYPETFHYSGDPRCLQLFKDLPLPERHINSQSIGELLIGFFDYYSCFDFARSYISIRHGACTKRITEGDFFIEDPYDQRNAARCLRQLSRVKIAFKRACEALSCRTASPCLALIKVKC